MLNTNTDISESRSTLSSSPSQEDALSLVLDQLNAELARHHVDFQCRIMQAATPAIPDGPLWNIRDNLFVAHPLLESSVCCAHAISEAIVFIAKCSDRFRTFGPEHANAIRASADVGQLVEDFRARRVLDWDRIWGFSCMSGVYSAHVSCIQIDGLFNHRSPYFNMLLIRNDSSAYLKTILNDQLFSRLDGLGLGVSLSQSRASSAAGLSTEDIEDKNVALHRHIMSRFMDQAEQLFSNATDPSVGWNPTMTLINIWMANDENLESRWNVLLGEHATRLSAHAFYQWHVFSEMHHDRGDVDLATIALPLFTLSNYGLSLEQLNRVKPALTGQHHAHALANNDWDLFLSSIGTLYGADDPLFVFQQWKGLYDHGVSSLHRLPWECYLHHAQLCLLPDRAWSRTNHYDSYAYMATQYTGDDLHRMEATLALSGNIPPVDHPNYTALLGMFYYSPTMIPGSSWPRIPEQHAMLYVDHPVHQWYDMNISLGRTLDLHAWLDYYVATVHADAYVPIEAGALYDSQSSGV